jgi:hypothetical protein
MRRSGRIVCLIFWIGFCFLFSGRTFSNNQEEELITRARQFLAALAEQNFTKACEHFDQNMLKASGPDKLAEFWPQALQQFGQLKKQKQVGVDRLPPYDLVYITCEFEKIVMDARVVFDRDKKIAGFQFVPSFPPARYQIPDYVRQDSFEEIEVQFGQPGWELPGFLTLPQGSGPFPALVLVHGSGPQDRDETIGHNKPFKDIAWGLASRGMAVLRYDKRTKVYGQRLVSDENLRKKFTVREETIVDALEGVKFLSEQEKIDRNMIFILGHSLGAMLVPRIAREGMNLGIAGYIVMAGFSRPIEDAYLQQMYYILGLDGRLSDEDKKSLEELKATVQRIKSLTEADLESKEKYMNAGVAYWLDLKDYDPVKEAGGLDCPVLILQGKRDYQVTTEDFERWKKICLASQIFL